MLAFQAGDVSAFDRLVPMCKRAIFSLAYRYGLSPGDADDLAQEVFLRVYRARAKYRPEARFRSWLLRIATNLIISQARKRKHRRVVSMQAMRIGSGDDETDLPDERAAAPWERLTAHERKSALEKAMLELPEKQRVALTLNRFHDQSYEEVGSALGLKIPAVKSLLFRARQGLKDALTQFMEKN